MLWYFIYLLGIVSTFYRDKLLHFGPHFSQKLLLIILGACLTALGVSANMLLFNVLLQSALALKTAHAVVTGEHAAPVVLSVDVALQLLLCSVGEEALVALGGLDVRGVEGGVLHEVGGRDEGPAAHLAQEYLGIRPMVVVLFMKVDMHLQGSLPGKLHGASITLETFLHRITGQHIVFRSPKDHHLFWPAHLDCLC